MAGKRKKPKPMGGGTVVVLPSIYNETMTLLAEAHKHFSRYGEVEQGNLNARERIMYASEMSRVTIRLSCIMAWLMARKTASTGKPSESETASHYYLDCRDVCLNQHIEAESVLPKAMTELLDKTFELYQRVARLDDLAKIEKPTS